MANPKFWYYPSPGGSAETIDLGEGLAELFSDWEIDAQSAVDMSGGSYRTVGMGREVVTIERDRMVLGEELANQFVALQNHLDRGYSVAFAADSALAYCAPVSNPPSSSSTSIDVLGDAFGALTGLAAMPPNNSYMMLETQPPGIVAEILKATNTAGATLAGGGTISASAGTVFGYSAPAFLRWYRFWPVMKRPAADAGKNIVTNEHGQTFSLSVRLVPDYAGLFAFHPDSDQLTDWSLQPAGEVLTNSELMDPGYQTLDRGPSGSPPTFQRSHFWSRDGRG